MSCSFWYKVRLGFYTKSLAVFTLNNLIRVKSEYAHSYSTNRGRVYLSLLFRPKYWGLCDQAFMPAL